MATQQEKKKSEIRKRVMWLVIATFAVFGLLWLVTVFGDKWFGV